MAETKRGGSGRGQGRKPVKQGEETVTVSLRMTSAQREKLGQLGGAEWVRQRIDNARIRIKSNIGGTVPFLYHSAGENRHNEAQIDAPKKTSKRAKRQQ